MKRGDIFNLFRQNSDLNKYNFQSFMDEFALDEENTQLLEYPAIDLQLKPPTDDLFKIMYSRQSHREFSGYKISETELSSLFSSFTEINGRRLIPSAGGKYPIETYGMIFHSSSKLEGKIVYHNWRKNALSIIAPCPTWQDIEPKTGLLLQGEPSVLFIFVAFPQRTISKYGERGGRFLFIEAGHYLQNLSLRAAYEGLKGVEAGGLFDAEIKELLGLGGTDAVVVPGYALGR